MTALVAAKNETNLRMSAPSERPYSPKVIRLAMDAIGVPNPPMLTPARSPCQSWVNAESVRAAGTLLTTWLRATDPISAPPSIIPDITSDTACTEDTFPTNTKRSRNVRRSP